MTLVGLALGTAAVLAFVCGGRPSTFGRPTVRRFGLLGVVVIAVATSSLAKSAGVSAGWLIVAALATFWFTAINRGRPGLGLTIVGLGLNAIVMLVNGSMPVSLAAVERAGVPISRVPLDTDPIREALTSETVLPWLGEAVPLALPIRPAVASPGDVLVAAGGALFIFTGLTGFGRTVPARELTPKEVKDERRRRRAEKRSQKAAAIAIERAELTPVGADQSPGFEARSAPTSTSGAPDPPAPIAYVVPPVPDAAPVPIAAPPVPDAGPSADLPPVDPAEVAARAAAAAAEHQRRKLQRQRRRMKRERKQQQAANLRRVAGRPVGAESDGSKPTLTHSGAATGGASTPGAPPSDLPGAEPADATVASPTIPARPIARSRSARTVRPAPSAPPTSSAVETEAAVASPPVVRPRSRSRKRPAPDVAKAGGADDAAASAPSEDRPAG